MQTQHTNRHKDTTHAQDRHTDPPRNTQNPYTYKAHTAQTADTLYTAHTTHKHTTLHPHDTQHTHTAYSTQDSDHTHTAPLTTQADGTWRTYPQQK